MERNLGHNSGHNDSYQKKKAPDSNNNQDTKALLDSTWVR